MQTITETDLVAACRRGNPRAQRELYERLAPRLRVVCGRYVRQPEDAEEVLLLGFAKAFEGLAQYRHAGCLHAWVRRIVVNTALNFLRQPRPRHLGLADNLPGLLPVPARAEADLAAADLLRLVQGLPTGYRTVFRLAAIEGYSHAEIGARLGISEGTSKSQLAKARQQLQRQLAPPTRRPSYPQALTSHAT